MSRKVIDSNQLRIFEYLKPNISKIIVAIILVLFSTSLNFFQPFIVQHITDEGLFGKNFRIVVLSTLVLGVIFIIDQSFIFLQNCLFADIHNETYLSLFSKAFEKVLHLKLSYFEDKQTTEVLSCINFDVSQVSSITDQDVIINICNIFRIISGTIGLCLINWRLALTVLLVVPVKIFLVHLISKQRECNMTEMMDTNQSFSQWFGDSLNGIKEIKLWNLYKTKLSTFCDFQKKLLFFQKRFTILDSLSGLSNAAIERSLSIALYILGGWCVCSGTLSIGTMFAFLTFTSYVTGPISSLIDLVLFFTNMRPSLRRLSSFFLLEEENDIGKLPMNQCVPQIQFSHVSFEYDLDRKVLDNVNFTLFPGEKVAIIGPNGSGKSTFISLLLRFIEKSEGNIYLNDLDYEQIKLSDYRNLFSVVSQDPYLFCGSINDNIDLDGNKSKEEIEDAIQKSGASEFISKMPESGKTLIGRNGMLLSGGERQKIAVARALLKKSPIIILDEATSSFDTQSDAFLHDILLHHLNGQSLIMVTHRYNNLDGMDRVYKIVNGRFVLEDSKIS